ncbi:MAG: hypothetical protein ACYDAO_09970 [Thermoplasmataceae archaeon]
MEEKKKPMKSNNESIKNLQNQLRDSLSSRGQAKDQISKTFITPKFKYGIQESFEGFWNHPMMNDIVKRYAWERDERKPHIAKEVEEQKKAGIYTDETEKALLDIVRSKMRDWFMVRVFEGSTIGQIAEALPTSEKLTFQDIEWFDDDTVEVV